MAPLFSWWGAGLDRTSAPGSAAGQGRGTHWQPQGTDGGACIRRVAEGLTRYTSHSRLKLGIPSPAHNSNSD